MSVLAAKHGDHGADNQAIENATVLPNFLIVGAAKCGTTSLSEYLSQHPEVFLSPYKEPNYFALQGRELPLPGPATPDVLQSLIYAHCVTEFDAYRQLFSKAKNQKAVGEASVRYLYFDEAPPRIYRALPDVKIVIVLRQPVDRMYSHYCMNKQFQLEPLSFLDALEAEHERRDAGWGWDWHYRAVSSYANQVTRYLDRFGRDRVNVVLYDDWVKDPAACFASICQYLGVDPQFQPNMNRRGKVASEARIGQLDRWLQWPNTSRRILERTVPSWLIRPALKRLASLNQRPAPKLDAAVRNRLTQSFRDEIAQLDHLLGRTTDWGRS